MEHFTREEWESSSGIGFSTLTNEVKRSKNKVADQRCNRAMDEGGGEWWNPKGVEAILGALEQSESLNNLFRIS